MAGDETTPQKFTKFTPNRRQRFLELLRQRPNIAAAAEDVGISRRTAYKAYHQDPDFAQAWEEALNAGLDDAEEALYERGVKGWLEPVYYKGEEVGSVRKFSDTCLIRFLQAHRPNLYAEKYVHRLAEDDPVSEALKAVDGLTLGPPSEREGAYLPPAEDDTYDNVAPENGDSEEDE